MIATSYADQGIKQDAFQGFVHSIAYNYYAWLSIIMVGIVAYTYLDFGPMAKAEKRAVKTGKLANASFSGEDGDEDDFSSIPCAKGRVSDLLIPVVFLVIGAFLFMLYTGGFFASETRFDLMYAVNNMNGTLALVYAIALTIIFSIIHYKLRKLSSIKESLSAFIIGNKSMVFLLILLVFAWAIGGICSELDTGGYVASLFSGTMPAFMAPFLVFLFSCITAFATGASFGTYAIMMPVAIPLAVALNADVYACIAAVIGGGGFGNHCSPLADTAILSSAGANIRHIDHIKTQIPYSVTCAAVAGISYILAGVLKNPVIPMIACFGLFILAVVVLHKLFGSSKYELDELEDTGNLVGALSESAK